MLHSIKARILTATILLAGLAAVPAFAMDTGYAPPPSAPAGSAIQISATAPASHKHATQEDMATKVEERINELHSQLKITPDEESAWNDVAQAMRDSEAATAAAVQERHEAHSAVDDLQAYQKIVQAHADAMDKFTTAFTPLYNSMPDAQKATADKVFAKAEEGKHHHHNKSNG